MYTAVYLTDLQVIISTIRCTAGWQREVIANQSMIQVFVGFIFNKIFKVRTVLFFKRVAEYLRTLGSVGTKM